jgi:archaemetzincin
VTFSGCNYTTSQPQNTTIYIQPFYPFSHERVTQAATEIQNFYHCKVVVLPECKIYDEARSKSGRYSAPILLDLLDKKVRTKDSKILALTSYDIFHEDHGVKEWGIFGLGNCPGNSCVVSDFRLKWFPEKTPEFTIKIILHELGHTFGLPHCDHDDRCLMNDAKGGIAPLYKERKILCSRCLNKLGIKAK